MKYSKIEEIHRNFNNILFIFLKVLVLFHYSPSKFLPYSVVRNISNILGLKV